MKKHGDKFDAAILHLYGMGTGITTIAKLFGVSGYSVRKILNQNNIKVRHLKAERMGVVDEIIKLYTKDFLGTFQIGEKYGLSKHTVRETLKKYGINTRCDKITFRWQQYFKKTDAAKKAGYNSILDWYVGTYERLGTLRKTAYACGVTAPAIRYRFRMNGIEMKPRGGFNRKVIPYDCIKCGKKTRPADGRAMGFCKACYNKKLKKKIKVRNIDSTEYPCHINIGGL